MQRRTFIQQAAPVTLAILPCLPACANANEPAGAVDPQAFQQELHRRFDNLPTFLKGDSCGFNLATAVTLLSSTDLIIEGDISNAEV